MLNISDIVSVLRTHVIQILEIVLATAVLWQLLSAGYNLFLHPLRRFPGPALQRASSLPWAIQNAKGTVAFRTQQLHDKYGPIVRIGPHHLSITHADAWKDIYGFQPGTKGGTTEMEKSKHFAATVDDLPKSIINADREEHQRFRRALAHGFSDSSMRAQEGIILRYIDKLMDSLKEASRDGEAALNIEAWYNWTTFDVAGDLVFGQSFRCLERRDYHPWIAFILGAIRAGAIMTSVSYVGLNAVVQMIFRVGGLRAMYKLRESTDGMMEDRLKIQDGRQDLFEGLVRRRFDWNISFDKLSANALILVLAGSETTATTLAGTTYLLLNHPKVLQKLNEEVRSSFKSASEININTATKLPYMLAVLHEALRLYPPVVSNQIRVIPAHGGVICSEEIPPGTLVEIQQWSSNHSPENWSEPWKFMPERFLDLEKNDHDRLDSLQPFSVGPRNCIGRNLAYAEMRMVLARLIFDFDMQLAQGNDGWIERQRAFGLWERIPLKIHLKPVKR
ncbi:Cytochrome P450 monooxygenase 1 [Colletotrichum sidae]|uniref:Cytochrome P450 monooxygenase 1 n=1 Tax=Colletotrichum sidae TaxID=1347389 RepID=A0A4R8TSJ5_9PEZI|nr:Cytochrome P450 monooxygenase 1 [Colletotrichum sidae]